MFQSVSMIASLKMAYVVFPSVSSAKSIFNVRIVKMSNNSHILTDAPRNYEFERKRSNLSSIFCQLFERKRQSWGRWQRWKCGWITDLKCEIVVDRLRSEKLSSAVKLRDRRARGLDLRIRKKLLGLLVLNLISYDSVKERISLEGRHATDAIRIRRTMRK